MYPTYVFEGMSYIIIIVILTLGLTDVAGCFTLFDLILALRVDIVKPIAYSIPLFDASIWKTLQD